MAAKKRGLGRGLDALFDSVPVEETVRGFKEILEGKHDEIPEGFFLSAGTIDEVVARMQKQG